MLSPLAQALFSWILGVVILVGCCAYVVVVVVVFRDKEFRRSAASIFLLNLLTIDLLNLLLVMPFSINSINGRWYIAHGWAQTIAFLGTWFEAGSVLALGVISLDRFMAVYKPFYHVAIMTKRKAFLVVMVTWVQALFFSLVPIPLGWYAYNARYMSWTLNVTNRSRQFRIFMVFFVVCNFLFSFLIVTSTYIYIFKVARQHRKSIAKSLIVVAMMRCLFNSQLNQKMQKTQMERKKAIKSALKMSVVIGAFVVCHTPYSVVRILDVMRRDVMTDVPVTVTAATKWLSYVKSALDPFIYFIVQHRFRVVLGTLCRAVIRGRRERRVGAQPPELSSRRATRVTSLDSEMSEDVSAAIGSRRTTIVQRLSTASERPVRDNGLPRVSIVPRTSIAVISK